MTIFNHPEYKSHEQVVFARDEVSGLKAIIAVHDTRLGPAVGGCRMFPYTDDAAALTDALRLSRGMTYKSALAGLPFGGGKSVILGDPRHEKTPDLLRAMGAAVERLGGAYVIAEDSGTSPRDMRIVGKTTRHVAGVEDNAHGGDPSPATAMGVFLGLKAGVQHHFDTDDLQGLRVAVQGLGNVGYHLVRHLTEAGASVVGCDVHEPNVRRAQQDFGIDVVAPAAIMTTDCDVFAPCALGAILDAQSIDQLQARVVAGAANNQLATDDDEQRLVARGITYCPDFALNAGGIIEVYHQRVNSPDTRREQTIASIADTVTEILQRAASAGIGSQQMAIKLAEERLASNDFADRPDTLQKSA